MFRGFWFFLRTQAASRPFPLQSLAFLSDLLLSSLPGLCSLGSLFLCPKLAFGQRDRTDQAYRVVKSTSTALVCCCQRRSFCDRWTSLTLRCSSCLLSTSHPPV